MSHGNAPSPAPENGASGPTDGLGVGAGDGVTETSPTVPAHGTKSDDASQRVQDVLGSDVRISAMNFLKSSLDTKIETADCNRWAYQLC